MKILELKYLHICILKKLELRILSIEQNLF